MPTADDIRSSLEAYVREAETRIMLARRVLAALDTGTVPADRASDAVVRLTAASGAPRAPRAEVIEPLPRKRRRRRAA